jgi:methionine-rich copper-binding protein CopC
VVLAAMGALVLGVPGAHAHAELTSSSPTENAVLASPPTTVRLTFNEDLMAGFAMLTVAVGKSTPQAVRAKVDGRTLTAPVPAGKTAGRWVVTYRIVSADGHVMSGILPFTVRAASPARSTTGSTTTPPPEPPATETPTLPSARVGSDLRGAPVTGQAAASASEDSGASAAGLGWWAASAACLVSSAVLALRGRRRS